MLHVVLATRNRHKLRELRALLPVAGIRWHSLRGFPALRSVPEQGRTFEANAVRKARTVARSTGLLALADDSGLEVEALGGRPGVQSARFAGRQGDDQANNEKLLRLLDGMPAGQRRARYRCALALAGPSGLVALTRGTWSGRIAPRPRGRRGFGYDPLFYLPRFGKTVGQLPAAAKQRVSHRAAAARRMQPVLRRLARRDVNPRR
jgi:XTP/dITP diphosphohydrolase